MTVTKRTTTKHYVRWDVTESEPAIDVVRDYDGVTARVVSLLVEYVWYEETREWRSWHTLHTRKVKKDGSLFANASQSFIRAPWIEEFIKEHTPDWVPAQNYSGDPI